MNNIVGKIASSKKYRAVYRPVIERVVADCLARYGEKRAEAEARNLLHQIWGSYYGIRPDFKKLTERFSVDRPSEVLALHASTAERLPILADFYKKIFAVTGVPKSIVDYGCGFNPLTYSWMGLPTETRYRAFDIDLEEVAFLKHACNLLGYHQVSIEAGDALSDPAVPADVVFMLKLLPVFEQQQKGSAREVLLKQKARSIVVSYPITSLAGKEKGMIDFYSKQFTELIAGTDWKVGKLLFVSELVLLLTEQ